MEDFKIKWVLLKAYTLLKNIYIEVEHRIYTNHFSKGIEDYSIVTFSPNGTVAVVALYLDNESKETEVILVRQYRPAADRQIVNLPGGRIDNGQTAETAARIELRQETGYVAENFERLHETFSNPTRITDKAIIFLARNIKKEGEPKLSNTEKGLEVITVNLNEVIKLLSNEKGNIIFKFIWPNDSLGKTGELGRDDICDSTTIVALMLAYRKIVKI